jgi:glycosyltransferase involved in cell wall biosynthesis
VTPRGARVCIVTPGYLSSTPRVVREADALAGAGFRVRVVCSNGQLTSLRQFDRDLLARRDWQTSVFNWSSGVPAEYWAFHQTRIRHGIARALPDAAWSVPGVLERAEGRVYPELAALAAAEPADLYIGHYPDGLAAASQAAERHRAALGYDVEDLYVDTVPETPDTRKTRARISAIERRYVPRCSYVSAVSAPVAAAFTERYGGAAPVVLHNCHLWSDRKAIDGLSKQRRGPSLSLYWFSQTVGLNRGIQDAIRAAGVMRAPVQIHLQGSAADDVKRELSALAAECGVAPALTFHESVAPDELLSRAAEHDVGLALETPEVLNRRLAVTNKQFLYFLAGLGVAASDLPGQRGVMEASPNAGALYDAGDFRSLAALLDAWAAEPAGLAAVKQSALEAARTRWNWECESRKLLTQVADVLASHGDQQSDS